MTRPNLWLAIVIIVSGLAGLAAAAPSDTSCVQATIRLPQ